MKKMNRTLSVKLTSLEIITLKEMAEQEIRTLEDQARYLLVKSIKCHEEKKDNNRIGGGMATEPKGHKPYNMPIEEEGYGPFKA